MISNQAGFLRAAIRFVALQILLLLAACSPEPSLIESAHFEVEVEVSGSIFDHVGIHIKKLDPNEPVRLTLVREWDGELLCSWAMFEPNREGFLDVTQVMPTDGSYDSVDASGLFWSSVQCDLHSSLLPRRAKRKSDDFGISTVEDFVLLAEQNRHIIETSFSVPLELGSQFTETRLLHNNSDVILFEPTVELEPSVLLVWLGGSSRGHSYRVFGARSASLGYKSASIAYFGTEHLAGSLANIELYDIAASIQNIRDETAGVEKLVLVGVSRGAEAAVLLSDLVQADGLVLVAPNAHVWGDFGAKGNQPAWLLNGVEVPFLDTEYELSLVTISQLSNPEFEQLFRAQFVEQRMQKSKSFAKQLHVRSNLERSRLATLPVDKLTIPIEVHVGSDDQVTGLWAAQELARWNSEAGRENLDLFVYQGAGHAILGSGKFPRTDISDSPEAYTNGGSTRADSVAQREFWENLENFLERL